MSTHLPGFQSFLKSFLHHFVLAKLATSSIRVKSGPFYNWKTTYYIQEMIAFHIYVNTSCHFILLILPLLKGSPAKDTSMTSKTNVKPFWVNVTIVDSLLPGRGKFTSA